MKPIFTFNYCVFFCFLFISTASFAQVGINTTTPNGILDVNSSTAGVVLPRLVLTATNVMTATNPQTGDIPAGTVVYNTATTNNASNNVSPGIYVWDGGKWIPQFTKKQTAFYESDLGIRTKSNEGYKDINGLVNRTFTPKYTGNYKIEFKVNYGGGRVKRPINGHLNVASETGEFILQVINDNSVLKNYFLRTQAFSTYYYPVNGKSQYYFDIWEEYSSVVNLSLEAGNSIDFTLAFNQDSAPEFQGEGNSGDGRGNVGKNIPCTVEITYIGQ